MATVSHPIEPQQTLRTQRSASGQDRMLDGTQVLYPPVAGVETVVDDVGADAAGQLTLAALFREVEEAMAPYAPQALEAALDLAQRLAVAKYVNEAARIARGHAIAQQGGVRLCGAGLAEVQSQSQPAMWYVVNGHCRCLDSRRAPEGRCKHRWAKLLLVWAQTHLAQHTGRRLPDAPPTPYDFPRWRRYEATYQGPITAMQPVNGIAELVEPGWFFFQPTAGDYGWEAAYHEVALGAGLDPAGDAEESGQ